MVQIGPNSSWGSCRCRPAKGQEVQGPSNPTPHRPTSQPHPPSKMPTKMGQKDQCGQLVGVGSRRLMFGLGHSAGGEAPRTERRGFGAILGPPGPSLTPLGFSVTATVCILSFWGHQNHLEPYEKWSGSIKKSWTFFWPSKIRPWNFGRVTDPKKIFPEGGGYVEMSSPFFAPHRLRMP